MKYHIVTYGCQMNHSDSERIAAILKLAGLSLTPDIKLADFLIINSCSVRQSAINRTYGRIFNFRKLNKNGKIILTGCILETDKKKFKDKFNLIIDIKELVKNPKKLIKLVNPPTNKQEFKAFNYTDYFKINPQYRSNFSAYVPIMTGCNNFCSYCAVPYTRGREISRPAKEIVTEIKRLIEKGYKEITLLGQNVNSYLSSGRRSSSVSLAKEDGWINFPKLLKMINDVPGNFWTRFLTSYPKDMSDELIETMTRCDKVCEYTHIPIQSGDDEILEKMNRRYTAEQYLKLVKKIRLAFDSRQKRLSFKIRNSKLKIWYPPMAISTDIIIGYPGETKTQFANTAKIMRSVKFDMAYLAEYSPRPGTAASKLKDNVPIAEKKRRKEFLNDILRKTALANNKKYVGKIVEVLVEKNDGDFIYGKTRTFKNIKIPLSVIASEPLASGERGNLLRMQDLNLKQVEGLLRRSAPRNDKKKQMLKPGQFAKIKITKANAWGLEGEYVNS